MLLETAIGDAYGAGFEFADNSLINIGNTLTQYRERKGIPMGSYTDDAQMSIAIAEYMLENDEPNSEKIADYFVKCYKRDPRAGYASGFRGILEAVNSGEEFINRIRPNSTRNGAAMRSIPIGFLSNTQKLMEFAEIQAKLTHNTLVGIESSQAIALAANYFLYSRGPKVEFRNYVQWELTLNWSINHRHYVRCDAYETVNAVFTILEDYDNYADILRKSVALGGDTDSVASLALGIASCAMCFDPRIPDFLKNDLENGPYGHDYLVNLDRKMNSHNWL